LKGEVGGRRRESQEGRGMGNGEKVVKKIRACHRNWGRVNLGDVLPQASNGGIVGPMFLSHHCETRSYHGRL